MQKSSIKYISILSDLKRISKNEKFGSKNHIINISLYKGQIVCAQFLLLDKRKISYNTIF